MNSNIEMPDRLQKKMIEIAMLKPRFNDTLPNKFIRMMKENTSLVRVLTDGVEGFSDHLLERKNPLMVALGDSVTAGYFEGNYPLDKEVFANQFAGQEKTPFVVDLPHVYHEQFRQLLCQRFPNTSPSIINSGIAGDTAIGMEKRVYRDVVRYMPDLVLINASLNWGLPTTEIGVYRKTLERIIDAITNHTDAEIILLTPNAVASRVDCEILCGRVEVIRELAVERGLCVADVFKIWEDFLLEEENREIAFSNGINHPTIIGHEVYAIELMKLF